MVSDNIVKNLVINNKKKLMVIIGAIIAIICAVIVSYLVFGGKNLNCTISKDFYGMPMDMELDVKFRGNKPKEVHALLEIDLGDKVDKVDFLIDKFKNNYSDYNDKGIDIDVYSDGNIVYAELNVRDNKLDVIDLVKSFYTYEELKDDLESKGYNCE